MPTDSLSPYVQCMLFCVAGYFGLSWLMAASQRHDIRERNNLKGSFLVDVCASCFCHPCVVLQSEKESKKKAILSGTGAGIGVVDQQYAAGGGENMIMAPQRRKHISEHPQIVVQDEGVIREEQNPSVVDQQYAAGGGGENMAMTPQQQQQQQQQTLGHPKIVIQDEDIVRKEQNPTIPPLPSDAQTEAAHKGSVPLPLNSKV